MSAPALLGIDGGGTSTVAWLADRDGVVVGRGRSGPSNVKAIGPAASLAALDEAVVAAFADAQASPATVEVACLGLAGFDRPEDKVMLEDWSSSRARANRLVLVNDGDLVLAAGTPEGSGVAIIAGTGSISVGRSPEGRTARAGGWGFLFGDEGSAFAVAVAGLRLVAQRTDGRDELRLLRGRGKPESWKPPVGDALAGRLCEAIGAAGPTDLIRAVYSGGFDRARIAALAPAVLAAAEDDPDIVSWILDPAGYDLGQAVRAVALAIEWSQPILPLAMAGGFLLSAPPVAEAMLAYLRKFLEHEVITTPVPEPVRGALILAKRGLDR
jgi:N-acetylglucosamine kinase-like BadF-type ATPase